MNSEKAKNLGIILLMIVVTVIITVKVYNPAPTVVYSTVGNSSDIPAEAMYHIGNYNYYTTTTLVFVAEKFGYEYLITDPYSAACNEPGAVCDLSDTKAFHIKKSDTQAFWDSFCETTPDHIFCVIHI